MSREDLLQHHLPSFGKGVFAVFCNVVSIAASRIEQIEAGLRIAGLLVSIAVGLVTIWSLTRKR